MKKVIFLVSLVVLSLGFSACEKNDYQHPMHRNGSK